MAYQSILGGGNSQNPNLSRVLGGKTNPFANDFHPGQYYKSPEVRTAEYNAGQAQNNQIAGLKSIADGSSNLAYHDKINLINQTAKAGILQKADQLKLISAAVDQEGKRTSQAQENAKSPLQHAGDWLSQQIVGTVNPVINTLVTNPAKFIQTQAQQNVTDKMTQIVKQGNANVDAQVASGKMTAAQGQAAKAQAMNVLNNQAAGAAKTLKQSNSIDPIKAAGDAAQTALTVGTAGGAGLVEKIFGDVARPLIEKFGVKTAQDVAQNVAANSTKATIQTNAAKALSKLGIASGSEFVPNIAKNAAIGAGYGAAATASDKGKDATLEDYKQGAIQGGIVGGGLTVAGKAVGAGYGKIGQIIDHRTDVNLEKAQTALENKTGGKTEDLGTLTPEQLRGMTPQKINVSDQSDGARPIGVSTPQVTKVGVKDISNTSKVEVKTPQKLTDAQYTKQFKAISDSYDQAQAKLALLPPGTRQSFANSIDKVHQKQLEDLNNAYDNPAPTEAPSKVTKVTQQTTPAPKNVTTGGKPSGYVNTTGEKVTRAPKATNPTEPGTVNSTQNAVTVNKSAIGTKVKTIPVKDATQVNPHFKPETEISDINRILDNKETVGTGQKVADYYKTAKGEDWKVVQMSPDEYLTRAAKAMGNTSAEDIARFKERPMGDPEKYAAEMKNGDKFPMPWINEVRGSQEGRTRALAAKMNGDKEIPVALATKYKPEEAPVESSKPAEAPKTETKTPDSTKDNPIKDKTSGEYVPKSVLKAEARAVQDKLTTHFEDKPTITHDDNVKEAEDAVKLAHEQPEKAMDIAMGKVRGKSDAQEVAVRRAVENKARKEGDGETLARLGNSQNHLATNEAARRLAAESYNRDKFSPVESIKEINQARTDMSVKRNAGATVKSETAKISSKIPKTTNEMWREFTKGVVCQ